MKRTGTVFLLLSALLLTTLAVSPAMAQDYRIDAVKNCVFLNQTQDLARTGVKVKMDMNATYVVRVSGQAYQTDQTGGEADPMPGVVVFYADNTQDGYATIYKVLASGDSLEFTTPNVDPDNVFLLAFVMDYWPGSANKGEFILSVEKK